MSVRVVADGAGCGCGHTMSVILNFSMRVRVPVRAAGAGDVGVISEKDQRSLFQLLVRAAGAGSL